MVLSGAQQVVVLFTAVLFALVVLPRIFGSVATNPSQKEATRGFDSRYNRKAGPGPGGVRGQPVSMNTPGSKAQTLENMQQMKMMMEQEMKTDKYKPNSNKGYVFTLMPLYAIGVGVFAAYKFLKIKSADESQALKTKSAKGAKKSEETESQLTELEQRLAQTEKMLNSILTQLDPLTNCVKSVAQEQKNEIMSQLQSIRGLMKKRGMDCPPLNIEEPACERNLDDLIESLATHESLAEERAAEKQNGGGEEEAPELGHYQQLQPEDKDTREEGEQLQEETERERLEGEVEEGEVDDDDEDEEEEEEVDNNDLMPFLEGSCETNIEDIGATGNNPEEPPTTGLRRRNRPE